MMKSTDNLRAIAFASTTALFGPDRGLNRLLLEGFIFKAFLSGASTKGTAAMKEFVAQIQEEAAEEILRSPNGWGRRKLNGAIRSGFVEGRRAVKVSGN